MRTRLAYRLIAATLSLVMGLGVVLPVVQSICAAPLDASPMEAVSHMGSGMDVSPSVSGMPVAGDASPDLQAHLRSGHGTDHLLHAQHAPATKHDSDAHRDVTTPQAPPCESMPAPCSDTCISCCIVETDPAPWTTVRIADSAFSTTVPRRFDTVSLIAPLAYHVSRPALEHRQSSSSPVRLHVWTATFLT